MDERLPDTGFHQIGGSLRAHWAPSSATRTSFSYMRTFQDGGDRYDQLLGGDGNLISELNELSLDIFSARLETLGALGFDHASFTYSLNSQREERVNQGGNGNPTATIGHEPERTTVHGVQGVAHEAAVAAPLVLGRRRRVLRAPDVGGVQRQPVTGAVSPRRPRVPDGATFTQGGVFAQSTYDLGRIACGWSGRCAPAARSYEAKASDSPIVNGQPLWPDDSLTAGDVTFRIAGVADAGRPVDDPACRSAADSARRT